MAIAISATQVSMAMATSSPSVTVHETDTFKDLIFNQDLMNVFFNTDEFAETVGYYHSSLGTWKQYPPIYDNPSASVNLIGDTGFNSLRPQLQLPECAMVHRVLKGDRVKRKGKVYFVDDFISDGVGVTTVYLRLK